MLKKKKKDTILKDKLKNSGNNKNVLNGICDKNIDKVKKINVEKIDGYDIKDLEEKENEIDKISRKIYEENSKIKKINLHHRLIKEELEKKKLIDQTDRKKKNSVDYYKKITIKLQNNINNIEEYTNNITNDINILKMSIDDERNERIIYNNNMKILINEYNNLKKSISNLILQEKEYSLQNEKLKIELNELNKEKDTIEKKHREDFKTLQQKLKEQKILSSEQKIHELVKMKNNFKERIHKTIENTEEFKKTDKYNENIINDYLLENYEDEKKKKLNTKITLLKKLCLRILCINEYQKQNIKKLEKNIENMNNAINSIELLTSKKCDFDNIIINLNESKEKNYSLISRINLLNYETNVLIKLNKKMKEKFRDINFENHEIINLKREITNKMNDKMNHIKTSLINNEETYKLKKKCFDDCVMHLKSLYEFIKQYENNNDKLNLRSQIINKEKNFHFNYIHKYNEEILVDSNHLNDFLIFIEKYIYALNFYLPSPPFNYKKFLIDNPYFHNQSSYEPLNICDTTNLISNKNLYSSNISNELNNKCNDNNYKIDNISDNTNCLSVQSPNENININEEVYLTNNNQNFGRNNINDKKNNIENDLSNENESEIEKKGLHDDNTRNSSENLKKDDENSKKDDENLENENSKKDDEKLENENLKKDDENSKKDDENLENEILKKDDEKLENENLKENDENLENENLKENDIKKSEENENLKKDDENIKKDDENIKKDDENLENENSKKDDENSKKDDENSKKDDENSKKDDENLENENSKKDDEKLENENLKKDDENSKKDDENLENENLKGNDENLENENLKGNDENLENEILKKDDENLENYIKKSEENENYLLNHFNSRNIEYDKLKDEIPNELLNNKYSSKQI
ncbi:conserved Plasmodium protein, unknown function [Plasmodium gallinaceum]|uniref:Uncharacterized protein n=1 Tax=Plasmodium gallinaceum TaxID=5849 RepID=A0A1J1GZK9_PLAGA|nr:conserved Plasmodium protein, unknown function [Plasmodium gallinaceum]CRG98008.1 conserved Plasmodium protein, unknown function [Plasmodium gallinaceum]